MNESPEGRRWPTGAVITVAVLAGVAVLQIFLLLTRRGPDGFDADVVGSLGDWAAGFGTVVAVVFAYRQFTKSQAGLLHAEHRAEALKVTAWAAWDEQTAGDTAEPHSSDSRPRFRDLFRRREARTRDPRSVRVSNRSSSAVFDWSVTVVPSRGWDTYVRLSARLGPIHPDELKVVPLDPPHPSAVYRRRAGAPPETLGTPRFVVLRFNDAWGNGWVRTNGDLKRIPSESRFLPLLVHLRNPAMTWAGVLDEATWAAFRVATGNPPELPETLDALVEPDQPWLGQQRIAELNRVVQSTRLRRLRSRSHSYTYESRAITRKVSARRAHRVVRRFFRDVSTSRRADVLYMKGD
ncbi:hypothetical protein AB0F81_23555 [Actinoplanes sp. NPDC024001]|uniref:hypothetical protein n=1 Tax=Actinoplanes sp. NPDC024001 TaxID=3154598 RepID=UPI0033EDAC79